MRYPRFKIPANWSTINFLKRRKQALEKVVLFFNIS